MEEYTERRTYWAVVVSELCHAGGINHVTVTSPAESRSPWKEDGSSLGGIAYNNTIESGVELNGDRPGRDGGKERDGRWLECVTIRVGNRGTIQLNLSRYRNRYGRDP